MKKLLFIILFTMLSISGYTLSVKADSDNYVVKSFDIKIDVDGDYNGIIDFDVDVLINIILSNYNDIYEDNDNIEYQLYIISDNLDSTFIRYINPKREGFIRSLYFASYNGNYDFDMEYNNTTNEWYYISDAVLPLDFTIYYMGIGSDPIPDNDNNLFILVASTIALIIVIALSLIFKIKWLLIPASLLVLIPIIYVDNLLFKTSLVIVFIALIFITFYQEKGDQFE